MLELSRVRQSRLPDCNSLCKHGIQISRCLAQTISDLRVLAGT